MIPAGRFGAIPTAVRLHRRAASSAGGVSRVATSVVVTPSSFTIAVGGTQPLTAQVFDQFGSQMPGEPVAWSSGTPAIATVGAGTGLVTGVASGSATITATSGSATGTAAATVQAASVPTSVVVSPSSFSLSVDGTRQLAAQVLDQFGAPMAGQSVAWSSSDEGVATVDAATGLATAVAEGSATITATSSGHSGTSAATVVALAGFFVSPTGSSGAAGTASDPWDIATGFKGGPSGTEAGADDSIWIAGGSYAPGTIALSAHGVIGTGSDDPGGKVRIRAMPGERPIIDGSIDWTGDYSWIEDLYVTHSGTSATVAQTDGVDPRGNGQRLKRTIVTMCGVNGVAPHWSSFTDFKAEGCILLTNGRWAGNAPGWAYGFYVSNEAPSPFSLHANIILYHTGFGVHGFTEDGFLDNFDWEGNFMLCCGWASGSGQMLVTGSAPSNSFVAKRNFCYRPSATSAEFDGGGAIDGVIEDNYLEGIATIKGFAGATSFQRNRSVAQLDAPGDGNLWVIRTTSTQNAGWTMDHNVYIDANSGDIVEEQTAGGAFVSYPTLADWRAAHGFDTSSTVSLVRPAGQFIMYEVVEAQRGHAVVRDYDASGADAALDLSLMGFGAGDSYAIYNAVGLAKADPDAPVATGTYAGSGTVAVSMAAVDPPTPEGGWPTGAAPTFAGLTCNIFVALAAAVPSDPTIAVSANTVNFSATEGGASPAAQTVDITNAGLGSLIDLVATVSYGAGATGWLDAELDTTTAPATLTLTPTVGAIAAGDYTYDCSISSDVAGNSPQHVTGTLHVGASGATDPAGFDTFQSALGGAAHVPYAYDRRQNWSASAITDCRVAGATGPDLAPAGAPTLDGNGNVVFAAGDDMHSAAFAALDFTNPGSALLVAAINGSGVNALALEVSAGAAGGVDVGDDGAGHIGCFFEAAVATTVPTSATLRPIVVTWDALADPQAVSIQVGNATPVAHDVPGGLTPGACVICLGAFFPGGSGANGGCSVAALAGADHVVDSTEITAFFTYAAGLGATA